MGIGCSIYCICMGIYRLQYILYHVWVYVTVYTVPGMAIGYSIYCTMYGYGLLYKLYQV